MIPQAHRQGGTVMVVVLLFVSLLSLSTMVCLYRVRGDVRSVTIHQRNEQAYVAAMSGIQQAMAILAAAPHDPSVWRDNPDLFARQPVMHSAGQSWYFTLYAADPDDPQTPRYGPIDEAGKINLNTADAKTLAQLPGMTDERVDALLDYRDADDRPRPGGAEQDYYDGLDRPYLIPNGPFATVEELLMVRGFDGRIVYGEDANFNGLLDPNEADGQASFPPDNGDGLLDHGLVDVLTTFSTDPQVDNEGRPRMTLGQGYQTLRRAGLSSDTLQFIYIALREGEQFEQVADLLKAEHVLKNDYPGAGLHKGQTIDSNVNGRELAVLLDRVTTDPKDTTGRVNVNSAAVEVLAALPGLDENTARQIVDLRASLDESQRATIAWLYSQKLLNANQFKRVAPLLTARSYQYRIHVIGYGLPCRRYAVLDAVVDLSPGQPARVAYLRDVSGQGLPFALDAETVAGEL